MRVERTLPVTGPLTGVVVALTLAGAVCIPVLGQSAEPSTPTDAVRRLDARALIGSIVLDADGSNQRQLTDAPGLSDYPAWSPDGRSIAFMTTRDGWPTLPEYVPLGYEEAESGDYEIYVMDADGGSPRNVTRNGREGEQFPAWSPDGEHLVFSRYGCLVVSTTDGTAMAQLTPGSLCADGFPSWVAP